MRERPILLVDFDGVIHLYNSGWQGADVVSDGPVPGAIAFLWAALEHFEVAIYSARSCQVGGIEAMMAAIERWDLAHEESQGWPHAGSGGKGVQWYMPSLHRRLQFPTEKPPAFWTIDDRCTQFTGTFPDPKEILGYQTWTKKQV